MGANCRGLQISLYLKLAYSFKIIVAIKNTHRARDLTPTYDENYNKWGMSGGANNFLDFIEKELIPYVNKS